VSDECAADMARAARETANADVGLAVTGVTGPDELEGKPVGRIHLAAYGPGQSLTFSYTYNQGRAANKRRAVTSALALLRRALLAAG
jgi:nicotinamide mononucleotide (NMN) deamidase PncC